MVQPATLRTRFDEAHAYQIVDSVFPNGERQIDILPQAAVTLGDDQSALCLWQLKGALASLKAYRIVDGAVSSVVEPLSQNGVPRAVPAGQYTFTSASSPTPTTPVGLRTYTFRPGVVYHLIVRKAGARPFISPLPKDFPAGFAHLYFVGSSNDLSSHLTVRGTTQQETAEFRHSVRGIAPPIAVIPGVYDIGSENPTVYYARIEIAQELRTVVQHICSFLKDEVDVSEGSTKGANLLPRADALVDRLVWVDSTDENQSEFVRRIGLAWDELRNDDFFSPDTVASEKPPKAPNDIGRKRGHLRTLCDQIILYIAYITTPSELSIWLDHVRPGEHLSFKTRFRNDIPAAADQEAILEWLGAGDRQLTNGLIDVGSGFIYKTRPPGWPQRRDLIWVLSSLVLFSFIVMLAIKLDSGSVDERKWPHVPTGFVFSRDVGFHGWVNDQYKANLPAFDFVTAPMVFLPQFDWLPGVDPPGSGLFWGWILVLVGMLLHWLVTFGKNQQSAEPPRYSTERLLPHVSAHKVRIIRRFATAVLAWFVVTLTLSFQAGGSLSAADYLTFVLAGYTVDSVTDLIAPFLDQRSGQRTAEAKTRLGIDGSTASG